MQSARVLFAGCGGLGSNQAKIHQQAGVRQMDIVDHDFVEDSNRNRQFFTADDVGKPKAHQVLKNLAPFAVFPTLLRGYCSTFEDWVKQKHKTHYDAIICGVDSMPTMVAVAKYGLASRSTVIFVNVDGSGDACRIFIQRPGAACFACYMPQALQALPERRSCAPVAAIADILHVAVGFSARAVAGEILGAPIGDYNSRDITFTGFDIKKTVKRRPACPLCGSSRPL